MTIALYHSDFYAWTQQQAKLLQHEDFAELDLPNLVEELDAMGRSQKHELANRLRVLIMHLLKLHYQPERSSTSWRRTIREQRRRLELLLNDSPSLRQELADSIAYAYPRAREDASAETSLELDIFPGVCPWTAAEILDVTWSPGQD